MPLIINNADKTVIIQYRAPKPSMYKVAFGDIQHIRIRPMSDIAPKAKTHPHPYCICIDTTSGRSFFIKGGELLSIRQEAKRMAAALGEVPVEE